jgi:cytochrome c oxidase subunit IV
MTDKVGTDKASITAPSTSGNVIAKYLPVYFVLLAIAGLEVFLAYRNFSALTLLVILLAMAVCGATLAVMYFMHLAEERPSLFLSLIPAMIFVLFMMNVIWTDSFRLLHMKPFAH